MTSYVLFFRKAVLNCFSPCNLFLSLFMFSGSLLQLNAATAQPYTLLPDQWYKRVGATPFTNNPQNVIDITEYCNFGEADHTSCIQKWIQAGNRNRKHLFASKVGTYNIRKPILIPSGTHIRCQSPKTIFKKISGSTASFTSASSIENVSIENCGFDMNGDRGNFSAATGNSFANFIHFNSGNASRVTIRENRIFDSDAPNCIFDECQRQYVVIKTATDILVEKNHLSHGGRIKVGSPGRRIAILNNKLEYINDNGITVVDGPNSAWPDGTRLSEDILISGNTVFSPMSTGIFFGADGEEDGGNLTTRRIAVLHNKVSGALGSACIRGRLPDNASEILIAYNDCRPKKFREGLKFISGIQLPRANNSTGSAKAITVLKNFVWPEKPDTLGLGGYFVGRSTVCFLDNVVQNSNVSLWLHSGAIVFHEGNYLGGKAPSIRPGAQFLETNRKNCYLPKFLRHP